MNKEIAKKYEISELFNIPNSNRTKDVTAAWIQIQYVLASFTMNVSNTMYYPELIPILTA